MRVKEVIAVGIARINVPDSLHRETIVVQDVVFRFFASLLVSSPPSVYRIKHMRSGISISGARH